MKRETVYCLQFRLIYVDQQLLNFYNFTLICNRFRFRIPRDALQTQHCELQQTDNRDGRLWFSSDEAIPQAIFPR